MSDVCICYFSLQFACLCELFHGACNLRSTLPQVTAPNHAHNRLSTNALSDATCFVISLVVLLFCLYPSSFFAPMLHSFCASLFVRSSFVLSLPSFLPSFPSFLPFVVGCRFAFHVCLSVCLSVCVYVLLCVCGVIWCCSVFSLVLVGWLVGR